ncbi:MAG: hypothetical protein IT535_14460, partial [Bauldia sp.]|nr:hypothetical protein [Bauldia sp.]
IIRSTQFFEFLGRIAGSADRTPTVRLSPALVRPIAGDDVAEILADLATRFPLNETTEVAGPDAFMLHEAVQKALRAGGDERPVLPDPHAPYFGAELGKYTLIPGEGVRIGPTRLSDWLRIGKPMSTREQASSRLSLGRP